MEDLVIREFNIEDYRQIISLWDKVNLPYRPEGRDSPANITQQIANGTTIFLVVESDDKLVGTVLGTHDGRKGWINRLALDPEYRRRSIARRLVNELERRFDKLGLEVIACLIEGHNAVSLEVFKKLGYNYYDVRYFSKRKSVKS